MKILILIMLLTIASVACSPKLRSETQAPERSKSAGPGPSTAEGTATATDPAEPASEDVPTRRDASLDVSEESLGYARSLGGKSLQGQALYFIIGKSVRSEKEAQAALKRALPLFGDMQAYFIVQRTETFAGMTPGLWVVVEAYRKKPSQEDLDLARRAFPDAYVKSATVRANAPIPVYEDRVSR
jgi:hypothetical protein